MIRLVACLLWLAVESFVKVAADLAILGIKKLAKAIRRWRTKRKMRSWHEEHGGPPDEILEPFNSQPDEEVSMDALKGALKSKLIWLGVAQVLYGLVQLWANGMLTIDSAGPVVSGALTMVLRAVTKESLAEKAKQ